MINLAGVLTCDAEIAWELRMADIPVTEVQREQTEVPYSLIGELKNWKFTRAWYYWVARAPEGQGIPQDVAEKLNAVIGRRLRVEGFAGGDEVKRWLSPQGTIDLYHIDSLEALMLLAQTISRGLPGR